MDYTPAFRRHKKRLQIAAITSAIGAAFIAPQVHAVVTTTVSAANGQNITLTPNEEYLLANGRLALSATGTGTITGEGVLISVTHPSGTVNRATTAIGVTNGGKVFLTGATIKHLNPSNGYWVADHTRAIYAYGSGTLVDISDSKIESFNHLIQVVDGATAKFHNTEMIAHRHGLNSRGIGSSIHVTDSDITFLGPGTSVNARNGALVTARNTYIHANGNYGSALFWDSNITQPNQTQASKGIYDHVTIETQRDASLGYGIWLVSRSQFFMDDSHIIVNGSRTKGIYADRSQEISEVHNTKIETYGSDVNAVSIENGSQIVLENNSEIITFGDNSNALYAHHNNSDHVAPTKITATDLSITLNTDGANSYGVRSESAGSQIYLNNVQLTAYGENATGLFAKEAGSILHADRFNAQIHGDSSTGMRVQNGANVKLNDSLLNVTGDNSHGIVFNTANTSDANSLQIVDSHIETQDGYAIQNQSGSLALNLNNSTLIGCTGA